jgi:hypothetical protein
MKSLLFFFILLQLISDSTSSQTFLNGGFEINTVTSCMINNISNSDFDTLMSNVKGIGQSQTIDIFYDIDCPNYGLANGGHYYVSVENNSSDTTLTTMISLKLADTLHTNTPYRFCYYDRGIFSIGLGPIEIGVSDNDSTFGTIIYISPLIDTVWTMRTVSFNSPINASYVTVKYGAAFGGAIVDDFGSCLETGINEDDAIDRINVFPNPAEKILSIDNIKPNTDVRIFDALGKCQKVLQTISGSTMSLDIEALMDGVYFVVINNTTVHKIIKH